MKFKRLKEIGILTILFLSIFSGYGQAVSAKMFSGAPGIYAPEVMGIYPGTPFQYYIAASGQRPLTYEVRFLPNGLQLDPGTGIITGSIAEPGTYVMEVKVSNALGSASRKVRIEAGEELCLTPPLGWNSWNVFTGSINEKMLLEIADAMVSSGMREAGYTYLNIDDLWHADQRDAAGRPVADSVKFPHGIRYLADYLHARGLKLGIYSDAGTMTCAKEFGSYWYEEIDAKTYAEWGVDLLKYDFCHVPWKKSEAIARYTKMGKALRNSGRSIVYSICNWGLFKPWEWAESTGGHYWRTTPDIFDTWKGGNPFMMSTMNILKRQRGLEKYSGPGRWNDPDMLIVGNYGKGNATSRGGMFKGMTDRQYESHFALWAILNSPMLASNDLRTMQDKELELLTHLPLLALNQDPAGRQAVYQGKRKGLWFYTRNGSKSESLIFFNPTGKVKECEPATFGWAPLNGQGVIRELVSGKEIPIEKLRGKVQVEPYQVMILSTSKVNP